jgi:hypothetical protein
MKVIHQVLSLKYDCVMCFLIFKQYTHQMILHVVVTGLL